MESTQNPLPGVPAVESPFFEQLFSGKNTDAETLRAARDLHEHGFAVLDFPDNDVEAMADTIRRELHGEFDWDYWQAEGHRSGISLRVQDAWRDHEAVRRIACNRKMIELLSKLYGRRAWPFQTLNFPTGSQQHFHSDSIHFSSMPERFMCGVWLALEDVDEENGPLVYYPGSHKWPIYTSEHIARSLTDDKAPTQGIFEPMWRELVEASHIAPRYFHARKGQALIWAANLMHGGAKQKDPKRTRWSQVTHYYFDDCAYYTPLLSDMPMGRIHFRDMVDISTGRPVPNRFAGRDVPAAYIDACMSPDGWHPFDGFDPQAYLAANPDVARAGINAAEHYLRHGFREKRPLR